MKIGNFVGLTLALVAGLLASPIAAQAQTVVYTNATVTGLTGAPELPGGVKPRVYVSEGNRVAFTMGTGLSMAQDRHPAEVTRMTLSPDNLNLITYSEQLGGEVHQTPMYSGQVGVTFKVGVISNMIVLKDNRTLVTLRNDGKFHFYSLETGKEVTKQVARPNDFIVAKSMSLSPNGRYLTVGETNGVVRTYDTVSWAMIKAFKLAGEFASVAYIDATRLAAADNKGYAYIFNPYTGQQLRSIMTFTSRINTLVVVDSNTVAYGCEDATVRFRNITTGAQTRQLNLGRPVYFLAIARGKTYPSFISAAGQESRLTNWPL